jgi:hypothetical protein
VDKGFGFERRHALAKAGGATRAVYGELAELGLAGLAVPEAHGGLGFGAVEAMVVMEELGRGLVNAPYAAGALVAPALLAHGTGRSCSGLAAEDRRGEGAGGAGTAGARRALPLNQVATRGQAAAAAGARAAASAWCRPATRPMPSSCRRAQRAATDDDAAGIALFLVDKARPAQVRGYPPRTARAPPTWRWPRRRPR